MTYRITNTSTYETDELPDAEYFKGRYRFYFLAGALSLLLTFGLTVLLEGNDAVYAAGGAFAAMWVAWGFAVRDTYRGVTGRDPKQEAQAVHDARLVLALCAMRGEQTSPVLREGQGVTMGDTDAAVRVTRVAVPKTQDEKVAFRKDWDERYEQGQKRQKGE